jgi:hypothetical protein
MQLPQPDKPIHYCDLCEKFWTCPELNCPYPYEYRHPVCQEKAGLPGESQSPIRGEAPRQGL